MRKILCLFITLFFYAAGYSQTILFALGHALESNAKCFVVYQFPNSTIWVHVPKTQIAAEVIINADENYYRDLAKSNLAEGKDLDNYFSPVGKYNGCISFINRKGKSIYITQDGMNLMFPGIDFTFKQIRFVNN